MEAAREVQSIQALLASAVGSPAAAPSFPLHVLFYSLCLWGAHELMAEGMAPCAACSHTVQTQEQTNPLCYPSFDKDEINTRVVVSCHSRCWLSGGCSRAGCTGWAACIAVLLLQEALVSGGAFQQVQQGLNRIQGAAGGPQTDLSKASSVICQPVQSL